jgi:hypothetical protein
MKKWDVWESRRANVPVLRGHGHGIYSRIFSNVYKNELRKMLHPPFNVVLLITWP